MTQISERLCEGSSQKVEFHRLDFALLSEDINSKTFRLWQIKRVVIPAPLSSRGPCVERHRASPWPRFPPGTWVPGQSQWAIPALLAGLCHCSSSESPEEIQQTVRRPLKWWNTPRKQVQVHSRVGWWVRAPCRWWPLRQKGCSRRWRRPRGTRTEWASEKKRRRSLFRRRPLDL